MAYYFDPAEMISTYGTYFSMPYEYAADLRQHIEAGDYIAQPLWLEARRHSRVQQVLVYNPHGCSQNLEPNLGASILAEPYNPDEWVCGGAVKCDARELYQKEVSYDF